MAVVTATEVNDILNGTFGDDYIDSRGGHGRLIGSGGGGGDSFVAGAAGPGSRTVFIDGGDPFVKRAGIDVARVGFAGDTVMVLRRGSGAHLGTPALDDVELSSSAIDGSNTPLVINLSNGAVLDSHIAGGTVFADANENGVLDDGESFATTDANGNCTLDGGTGPLVIYGGTDIATGFANLLTFRAPAAATVVSPLTTLVQILIVNGSTPEEAQDAVAAAFGIDTDVDLATFDPLAAPPGDPDALAVQQASATVVVLVSEGAELGGGDDDTQSSMFAALAEYIVTQPAPIDLADTGVVTAILEAVLASDGIAATAQQIADAAAAIDAATTIGEVSAAQAEGMPNDAPVATITAASYDATEQVALDLKGTLLVADVDAGSGSITVTLSVDYGIIHVALGTSGAAVDSGNDSASVTLSGTLDQINALLSSDATSVVTYTPDTNAPPPGANLTLLVDDNGNTGDGGALDDTATASIAIADTPELHALGNRVFRDADGDNRFDAGEGLNGVTVELLDSLGATIASIVTSGDGGYLFGGLAAGDYSVRVVGTTLPPGLLSLTGAPDPDDDFDGDDNGAPSGLNYVSAAITLTDNGEPTGEDGDSNTNLTLDFGFATPAPTVDLNGAGDGVDFTGSFAEDGAESAIGVNIVVNAPALPITGATITITDPLAGDQLTIDGTMPATITASGPVGTTTLTLTGTGTPADWAAALSLVRYSSVSDNPDAFGADPGRTITVAVSDGVASSAEAIAAIAVHGANDNPLVTDLSGDSVTWTEDLGEVLLDLDGNTEVSDVDSADFAGGSLQAGVMINPAAEDLVFITDTVNVEVRDDDVLVDDIVIGTATFGGGEPLVVTFNGEATPDRVQTLTRAIAYTNLGADDPTGGSRSIAYLLNDGNGGTDAGSVTVGVAPVNDAPTVANAIPDHHSNEDSALSYQVPATAFSDPEDDPLIYSAALANGSPLPGWLSFDGDTRTFTGTPPLDFNGSLSVRVTASDGSFDASDTFDLVIDPVNDAPSGIDHGLTVTEDTPRTLNAADFSFTDTENNALASVTIVALPGAGTIYYDADGPGGSGAPVAIGAGASFTAAQLTGARLSYRPAENGSGTNHASFTYAVRDNGGTGNGGLDADPSPNTITINVTPVNDAPASSGLDGDEVAYGEGTAAGVVWLDAGRNAVVADVDSADFAGGTLTVSIVLNKAATEDQLVFSSDSNGVTVSGDEVLVDGVSIGTFSADGVGLDRVFTLTSGATADRISRLISNFSYVNTDDATPSTAQRLVEFRLTDGDGGSMFAYTSVVVTAVNDAPVNTSAPVLASEDAIAVAVTGYSIFDVDADPATDGMTVTLSVGHGILSLATNVSDGVGAGQVSDNNSASITVTGTQNQINATLAAASGLTYTPTADYTGADQVTMTTGDNGHEGSGGPLTDTDQETITIGAVNDAPSGRPDQTFTFFEDARTAFSESSHFQIGMTDVEGHSFIGIVVTATPAAGTLRLIVDGPGGPESVAVADGQFVSVEQLDQGRLSYQAAPDQSGPGYDSFSFAVVDSGGTADGGQNTDPTPTTFFINVTAVNDRPAFDLDPPAAGVDVHLPYVEGDGIVVVAPNAAVSDVDSANFGGGSLTVSLNIGGSPDDQIGILDSGTDPGEIGVSGADATYGGIVIGTFLGGGDGAPLTVSFNANASVEAVQALVRAITYAIDSETPTQDTRELRFILVDGDGTAGFNGADTSGAFAVVPVTPVNDAPINAVPAAQNFDEDGVLTFSSANGNAITISDLDAGSGPLTVTLAIADGALTLSQTTGLAVTGNGAATVVLTGTIADINAALDGLAYAPPLDANGPRSLGVSTGDHGAQGPYGPAIGFNMSFETQNGSNSSADYVLNGADPDGGDYGGVLYRSTATLNGWGLGQGGRFELNIEGAIPDFIIADGLAALDMEAHAGESVGIFQDFATLAAGTGVRLSFWAAMPTGGPLGDPASGVLEVRWNGALIDTVTPTSTTPALYTYIVVAAAVGTGAAGADRLEFIEVGGGSDGRGTILDAVMLRPYLNPASDSDTVAIAIDPVNDAAVLTGTAAGEVTEAGGVENGTAGVSTANGDLHAADVDNVADAWRAVAAGGATANGHGTYELSAAGVWTYTLDDTDPDVQALNGLETLTDTFDALSDDGTSKTVTITIRAQDDAGVARDDAVTTTEASAVSGSVFADSGSGPDDDDDDAAPLVVAVNGVGAGVGNPITLDSGARLTLNADGTFTYDPDGAFDATPAPGSGASNTPATDSFAYTLSGGDTATVDVTITGLDTDDLLLGTAGLDTLAGGGGNDTYVVANSGDTVTELANGGNDGVSTSVDYQLAAGSHVERLSAMSIALTTPLKLTGNEFVNQIEGNAGGNVLDGKGGADAMWGYAGNDTYYVDHGSDGVSEAVGGGSDTIIANVSYTLAAGQEIELLRTAGSATSFAVNFTGNEFANTIVGNAATNIFDGKGGADAMYGYGGNDTYFVDHAGDIVAEAVGGGSDTIIAHVSHTLGAGQEVELLRTLGSATTYAVNLTGNAFANTIVGNAAANVLDGKAGADAMYGYAGNDTYYVDNGADTVAEAAGGGSDTIITNVSYTLGAGQEVELLRTYGSATTFAVNLTGNALANTLVGNAAANRLDGKSGADALYGYGGADNFAFTTAPGAGNVDTIGDFQAGIDKILLENAVFTGLAAGALAPGAFRTGPAAVDADDRIIYNSATGQLLFDADGVGGAAATQFASLTAGLAIAASDFLVI